MFKLVSGDKVQHLRYGDSQVLIFDSDGWVRSCGDYQAFLKEEVFKNQRVAAVRIDVPYVLLLSRGVICARSDLGSKRVSIADISFQPVLSEIDHLERKGFYVTVSSLENEKSIFPCRQDIEKYLWILVSRR